MSLEIIGAKHIGSGDNIQENISEKEEEIEIIFTEDRDFGLSLKFDSRFWKGFLAKPVFSSITPLLELLISLVPNSLMTDRKLAEELSSGKGEIKKIDASATEKIRFYDKQSGFIDWLVLVVLIAPQISIPIIVELLLLSFYSLAMQSLYTDFRDQIMAEKISRELNSDSHQLAIIGDRHVPGVKFYLKRNYDVEADTSLLRDIEIERYLDRRAM